MDAKYRPATWWEKRDGHKVKGSQSVDDLLQQNVGKCPETALKLVVRECFPKLLERLLIALLRRGYSVGIVVHLCLPQQF